MLPQEACILLIEDDPDCLMLITELLRMSGCKYLNARASGWQALKLADALDRVDLILVDIQLPLEDGYSVLRRIRSNPKLHATRVAAVTARVFPQEQARAREAGFDGFIGKPLDYDRFPQQIQALLRGERVWASS